MTPCRGVFYFNAGDAYNKVTSCSGVFHVVAEDAYNKYQIETMFGGQGGGGLMLLPEIHITM